MKQKPEKLHYETVLPLLVNSLNQLMGESLFNPFVLVGGTNLCLRLGHRRSDDIDLFTDVQYGSLDYDALEEYLKNSFPYYNCPDKSTVVGFGRSYYIGLSEDNCVKLDLMYADAPFFEPFETNDGIRMATIEQIAAMKMEAINTGGRKKDWWDIHELLKTFSLIQLLLLHEKWEEWTHNDEELLTKLIQFEEADKQPDPKCLNGKNWDDIKLDIIDHVTEAKEIIKTKNNKPQATQ